MPTLTEVMSNATAIPSFARGRESTVDLDFRFPQLIMSIPMQNVTIVIAIHRLMIVPILPPFVTGETSPYPIRGRKGVETAFDASPIALGMRSDASFFRGKQQQVGFDIGDTASPRLTAPR